MFCYFQTSGYISHRAARFGAEPQAAAAEARRGCYTYNHLAPGAHIGSLDNCTFSPRGATWPLPSALLVRPFSSFLYFFFGPVYILTASSPSCIMTVLYSVAAAGHEVQYSQCAAGNIWEATRGVFFFVFFSSFCLRFTSEVLHPSSK